MRHLWDRQLLLSAEVAGTPRRRGSHLQLDVPWLGIYLATTRLGCAARWTTSSLSGEFLGSWKDSELEKQMAHLRSKYPSSEADYLAAARARNAAKVQSVNSQASDADWQQAKAEAQQKGGLRSDDDDWEKSQNECWCKASR